MLLSEYGKISRNTGRYASLLVIFDTPEDLAEHYSVEAYEELFWSFKPAERLRPERLAGRHAGRP